MIFQKCIGPDMFSWIRHSAVKVCALPSALLVFLCPTLPFPVPLCSFQLSFHPCLPTTKLKSCASLKNTATFLQVFYSQLFHTGCDVDDFMQKLWL